MRSRRDVLKTAFSLTLYRAALARERPSKFKFRVGIMDVILGYASSPDAFAIAQRIGFDGIQVTLGKPADRNRLLLSDPELQERILQSSAAHKVAITSTYLDVLHRDCLQSNEMAKTWVREAIRITKALNAGIVELAFFFKCGLNKETDIDGLVSALRELGPEAEREGIILGVENTLSAEDNAHILERVGSPAVKIWYDIGNSTNMGHFDVPKEIRFLGKERICQIHVKDKVYLGSGSVDVKGCLRAIQDIGYTGWCVFETAAPTGERVADAQKNLNIFREIENSIHSEKQSSASGPVGQVPD